MLNLYMSSNVELEELDKWYVEPHRYGELDLDKKIVNTEMFWGNGTSGQSIPCQSFIHKNEISIVIVDGISISNNHYELDSGFLIFDETVVAQSQEVNSAPNIIVIGKGEHNIFEELKFMRNGNAEERTKFEKIWIKNTSETIIHEDIYLTVIDSTTMNRKDSDILINPRYPLNHPKNKNKIFLVDFMNDNNDIYPPNLDNKKWKWNYKIDKLLPGESKCVWVKGYVKYSQINKRINNILFSITSNFNL